MDFWTKLALFLLMGFTMFGRALAYLGIPPAKILIGDLMLAAVLCLKPRATFDRWHEGLIRGGPLGALGENLVFNIYFGYRSPFRLHVSRRDDTRRVAVVHVLSDDLGAH